MLSELFKLIQSQSNFGHVETHNEKPLAMPSDMKMVDLEQYNTARYRERYSMETPSITAFIDYSNKRAELLGGSDNVITSVSPDNCTARAIFNAVETDGEPGHCDDTAKCTLKRLPAYCFLADIDDSGAIACTQREVIEHIRDWHEYIENPAQLEAAFAKLTIDSVGKRSSTERDYSTEKTALEKIDVKAEGGEPPTEILITFIPYDGFTERAVSVSVVAVLSRDSIVLKLRVRAFETLKLSIAEEFAEKLTKGLTVAPIIGTIVAA